MEINKTIDIHTHAFPDFLAEKAMNKLLEHSGPYKAWTDGTINGLIRSMDESGINKSIIANIATKPEQINPILDWCKEIKTERIIPLASFYPDNPGWKNDIDKIKEAGIQGIKLHPMYQNFTIDDKKFYEMYEYLEYSNIFILFHSGFDIAYPKDERALPNRISNIKTKFKNLKIIAAHFGGWQIWDQVLESLCGKDIYFDTSFVNEIESDTLKNILSKHSYDRIVFGSDSPWQNQKEQVNFILNLKISDEHKEKIFYKNIINLLNIN